ncbi:hypothetical protein D9756_003441 [Leucocoprinus leucothites]|uniref:Uncharacterized protein n=1 Tax=Leucocoprinus leucothites TaxID=201217 RepID=A0A8H5G7R2_9AGAR|nr:hypothetical protein D9756_003441 [Leucoagaricus leucothites]
MSVQPVGQIEDRKTDCVEVLPWELLGSLSPSFTATRDRILSIDVEVIIMTVTSTADPVVVKIESNLYCHLQENSRPGLVNAAIVILSMVLLIPLEVWTGIQLYRCRSIRIGEDFRQYLTVYLRIAACTVVAAAAFGVNGRISHIRHPAGLVTQFGSKAPH